MNQLLTPNQWLLANFGLFLVFTVLLGIAFMLIYRKQVALANEFGQVAPLWRHVLAELSAIMRHDELWAIEQDVLMDEVLTWVPMDPARESRLLELVAERAIDQEYKLRKGEHKAAKIYPTVLELARIEGKNPIALTSIRLVGNMAPERQSHEDREARADAAAR